MLISNFSRRMVAPTKSSIFWQSSLKKLIAIDTIDPDFTNIYQNLHFLFLKPRYFLWIAKPACWATSSGQLQRLYLLLARSSFDVKHCPRDLTLYKQFSRCLTRPSDLVPRYFHRNTIKTKD